MDTIVEEESKQLENDLFKRYYERILELRAVVLGSIVGRIKERISEDSMFSEARETEYEVPAFQTQKREMLDVFKDIRDQFLDEQLDACRQRHVQQNPDKEIKAIKNCIRTRSKIETKNFSNLDLELEGDILFMKEENK